MLKKILVITLFLFLLSCGNNSDTKKNDIKNKVENPTSYSNTGSISSEDITLQNGIQTDRLSQDIFSSICFNLEGKQDFILEGNKKQYLKIEPISFLETHFKEDRTKNEYEDFLSLKDGKIQGVFKNFENLSSLNSEFESYKNKEDFFTYLGAYMIFIKKNNFEEYKKIYLELLNNNEEKNRESSFIGIILAEFYHNKSCSDFIKNNF